MLTPWGGKQMWIWELSECPVPSSIVSQALQLGLTGLIVKAWDGVNSAGWLPQFQSVVGPAHAAGLSVSAWGYSYGVDPSGEVDAMGNAVAAGADGLVIDAEAEYDVCAGTSMARELFAAVEASPLGAAPIAYTSFAFPDLHPNFPWPVFSAYCQVVMPQVYWCDLSMDPAAALTKDLSDLAGYGLPVEPVGQAYPPATSAQITQFGSAVVSAGLNGVSFWSWQHATSDMFTAIGRLEVTDLGNLITQDANGNLIKVGATPAYATQAIAEAMQQGFISQTHNGNEIPTLGEIIQIMLNILQKKGLI